MKQSGFKVSMQVIVRASPALVLGVNRRTRAACSQASNVAMCRKSRRRASTDDAQHDSYTCVFVTRSQIITHSQMITPTQNGAACAQTLVLS